jgi:hypothetical protein
MDKIAIVNKVIKENTEALNTAYKLGWSLAMYNRHQIGIQHAFGQFNALVPDNFRSNLDIHEAMILNSAIQAKIARVIKS